MAAFLISTIWFVRIYIYVIPVGKMAITNNVTSSFVSVSIVDVLASQLRIHRLVMWLSSSITPMKFQKQEKEDQRIKYCHNYNL